MSNVSENLFQAMDIIIAERLNGLNYDKTILCKIEDDSKKDKGEYVVTDGSSTFIAISKDDTYTKGASVYVTVPTGDFNQQKLIVGRYIAKDRFPRRFYTAKVPVLSTIGRHALIVYIAHQPVLYLITLMIGRFK